MSKTLKVEVKAKHIRAARKYLKENFTGSHVPGWTCNCPIAQAIKDVAGPSERVAVGQVTATVGVAEYRLSSKAVKFVQAVDGKNPEDFGPVKPATFVLREIL